MNRNGSACAGFIARASSQHFEPEVLEAAKQCLVDWFGVALGGMEEPASIAVRRMAHRARAEGPARILGGWRSTPELAALVNGTMAHALDFDDTHVGSLAHLSGPTWAATLAMAEAQRVSEAHALSAFITGFEVGARLGASGFGVAMTERGFHSTGVIGRLAATAAACHLLGSSEEQAAHALGLAATQAGGLTASFGTMAKPFHAGKAAMDGVLSARLAEEGLQAATGLLEGERGLSAVLVQDGSIALGPIEFGQRWELTQNSFKPYASCLLTHASLDATRRLVPTLNGQQPREVRAHVNPLAVQVANIVEPRTPLEGKFSITYCIALGLAGFPAAATDFTPERLDDPRIRELLGRIQLLPDTNIAKTAARLEVVLPDGQLLHTEVAVALGNPENPMGWDSLEDKFIGLVQPVLGQRAGALLDVLRRFETNGALGEAMALVAGS